MSTHAGIVFYDGKKYFASKVYHDGYFGYAGLMLILHYNTPALAKQITTLGKMEVLEKSYEETLKVNNIKGATESIVCKNKIEFYDFMHTSDVEGCYIFKSLVNSGKNEWSYVSADGKEYTDKDILASIKESAIFNGLTSVEEVYEYLLKLPKIDPRIENEVKDCLGRVIDNLSV